MRVNIFVIIQLAASLKLSFNKASEVKFTNVICKTYNESWFAIHHCRLKPINRKKTVLNFNGTVLHPAYDISLDYQWFLKANGYKPWLYKATFDVCRFQRKPFNPIVIMIFKLIKKYTNFDHLCPYMGDQIVNGLYIDYENVPLPFPTGEYLLALTWLFDKRKQFITNVYFRVQEDISRRT